MSSNPAIRAESVKLWALEAGTQTDRLAPARPLRVLVEDPVGLAHRGAVSAEAAALADDLPDVLYLRGQPVGFTVRALGGIHIDLFPLLPGL